MADSSQSESNFKSLSESSLDVELKGSQPSLEVQVLIKLAETLHSKLQTLDPQIEFSATDFQKFKTKLNQLQRALDKTEKEGDEPPARGQEQRQQGRKGRYVILEEDLDDGETIIAPFGGSLNRKDNMLPARTADGMIVAIDEHGNEVHTYDLETYFSLSAPKILRGRLPWLVGLLLLQSFSATILGAFDVLLEQHIIVAYFIPMLVGSGGNAGNQPGVMVTRALGTGELRGEKILKVFRKEAFLALITASVIGLLGFFRVLLDPTPDPQSALAIGLSLWVVVYVAIFLGIVFSLVLDRLGVDPAAGSAPLLTTIADLVGITLLCLISSVVFGEV